MRNTNSAIFKAILNNYDLGQLISWRYPKGGALHDNIIIETTRGWFFLKYYRPEKLSKNSGEIERRSDSAQHPMNIGNLYHRFA